MCRICGNREFLTRDCCPTPLETGLAIPKDDFEKLMYKVWANETSAGEVIPSSVVTNFYADWINGSPIDAESYLRGC